MLVAEVSLGMPDERTYLHIAHNRQRCYMMTLVMPAYTAPVHACFA